MTVKLRQLLNLKKAQDQLGLGLVETLVAVAILGTSVVAFAAGLSTGSITIKEQDKIAVAQGLVQTQLEYTKGLSFVPGAVTYPAVSTPQGFSLAVSVASVPDTDGGASIQKITVTVSHDGSDVLTVEGYKVDR